VRIALANIVRWRLYSGWCEKNTVW